MRRHYRRHHRTQYAYPVSYTHLDVYKRQATDFQAQAVTLAGTLKLLRDVPLVDEEYRGPVLFSANAAATVFSDILGDRLLGFKPDLGKNVRTVGDFAASYKTRVLPDFLSVLDDPTLASLRCV